MEARTWGGKIEQVRLKGISDVTRSVDELVNGHHENLTKATGHRFDLAYKFRQSKIGSSKETDKI